MSTRSVRLITVAVCMSLAQAAVAQPSQFDTPAATQTVPPVPGKDQITCIVFPDFMIRQSGTDTPAPDAAVIVPMGGQCAASRSPGEIATQTANLSLIGRKGGFLVFGATDPNGAARLTVLNSATGKTIYTDSMIGNGFKAVDLEGGALRIAFTRGINTTCSLLKEAKSCWAKLAADGSIPRAISQQAPPVEACRAAYGQLAADDPSIVSYPVDMTISLTGKTEVKSRGAVGCAPLP